MDCGFLMIGDNYYSSPISTILWGGHNAIGINEEISRIYPYSSEINVSYLNYNFLKLI